MSSYDLSLFMPHLSYSPSSLFIPKINTLDSHIGEVNPPNHHQNSKNRERAPHGSDPFESSSIRNIEMAGLPRSDVSFRRSGSSGLVWDDKLSGELKPKDDVEREKREQQRSEPKPYRTVEVEPTIDPPSPKVSGCGGICGMFGKNTTTATQKPIKRGHRTS